MVKTNLNLKRDEKEKSKNEVNYLKKKLTQSMKQEEESEINQIKTQVAVKANIAEESKSSLFSRVESFFDLYPFYERICTVFPFSLIDMYANQMKDDTSKMNQEQLKQLEQRLTNRIWIKKKLYMILLTLVISIHMITKDQAFVPSAQIQREGFDSNSFQDPVAQQVQEVIAKRQLEVLVDLCGSIQDVSNYAYSFNVKEHELFTCKQQEEIQGQMQEKMEQVLRIIYYLFNETKWFEEKANRDKLVPPESLEISKQKGQVFNSIRAQEMAQSGLSDKNKKKLKADILQMFDFYKNLDPSKNTMEHMLQLKKTIELFFKLLKPKVDTNLLRV